MIENFFSRLPSFADFRKLADRGQFVPAPDDWFVVLTDIQGSTQAIREGRYKDVNLVGAATIMAVLNCCKGVPIPYVFGGDGATLLVPPDLAGPVRRALGGSILMAKEAFSLHLRAGMVPIADLRAGGARVEVAKWALSPKMSQAFFRGGGLSVAETWVKDPERGRKYAVEPAADAKADFTGLECRWSPIRARDGEAASVLVKALGSPEQQEKTYLAVIQAIEAVYESQARPYRSEDLGLTARPGRLEGEAKIRSFGSTAWEKTKYRAWLYVQVAAGFFMVSRWGPALWKRYRRDVAANTDARKFDDMFRAILEGTPARHVELRALLEQRRVRGELVFGIHTAREMLLTCLVFNREGGHFHFIDGNDGGYALAAVELKKQIKEAAN